MKQKDLVKGIGKRVDEIIANSRLVQEIHIKIDIEVNEVPTIKYEVTEAAIGEEVAQQFGKAKEA